VLVAASIASHFGAAAGSFAALIAVCGFLGHAVPVLKGGSEKWIRETTVIGGLLGCGAGLLVVVLSALVG
jgi:hypothetical protein